MGAPIGSGDIVECIASRMLTVGALYCVDEVLVEDLPCPCHGRSPFGLVLRRQPTPGENEPAWCGLNFKPVKRRDESLIARLLSDTPTDEPVEA